jgi:hypothetical protein
MTTMELVDVAVIDHPSVSLFSLLLNPTPTPHSPTTTPLSFCYSSISLLVTHALFYLSNQVADYKSTKVFKYSTEFLIFVSRSHTYQTHTRVPYNLLRKSNPALHILGAQVSEMMILHNKNHIIIMLCNGIFYTFSIEYCTRGAYAYINPHPF